MCIHNTRLQVAALNDTLRDLMIERSRGMTWTQDHSLEVRIDSSIDTGRLH